MKSKIIIRADGGTSIGMGHVVRCLALADMLRNDFEIVFAIQEPSEDIVKTIHTVTESIIHLPATDDYNIDAQNLVQQLDTNDIVVLDGYHFKTDYQKAIKDKGCKLVCIDDLHDCTFYADAIINHAEGIGKSMYTATKKTALYLGPQYALLRKPFLEQGSRKKIDSVKKIFISMGAADASNLTQKFTEAIIDIDGIEEIHLMLGAINPNLQSIDELIEKSNTISIIKHINISADALANLLQTCDISICPASSISLESCAIGIGLISGYTADNQRGILDGLVKNKATINIGNMNTVSPSTIKSTIENLISSPEQIIVLMHQQHKMLDGKSPERIINAFKNLKTVHLHFRLANKADAELYFNWRNDPLVKNNSYNPTEIDYEQHVKWFLSKLESNTCNFYLFLNSENKPVGQVRIDTAENEDIIGISIDKDFRGKSIGREMLEQSTGDYLQSNPSSSIVAYIKQENKPSYSIFKKAGFSNEEMVVEQGIKSYKLFKTANLK